MYTDLDKYQKIVYIDFQDVRQDILMFCAFRYALGRATYVVGAIAEILTDNWDHMPSSRREMFKNEIREAIRTNTAGFKSIDVPLWEKILELPD